MCYLQPTYLSGFLKIQLPWGPSISYIFTKLFLTSFLQIRIINCPSIFDPFSPERWWRYLWTASYCVREYRVVVQPTFYTTYVRSGKIRPFSQRNSFIANKQVLPLPDRCTLFNRQKCLGKSFNNGNITKKLIKVLQVGYFTLQEQCENSLQWQT